MFFVFTSGGLFAFNGNERFKIVGGDPDGGNERFNIVGDDADGGNERFVGEVIVLVGDEIIGI